MEAKELIQIGLANIKRSLDRTLDGLTPAEVKWQPKPDANSIGLILFDIVRSEDSSVQSRLRGKPQLWESEKWYQKLGKDAKDTGGHYTAEQVAAFVVPDLKNLLEYAEGVRKQTLEYLKELTPEGFENIALLEQLKCGACRFHPIVRHTSDNRKWINGLVRRKKYVALRFQPQFHDNRP